MRGILAQAARRAGLLRHVRAVKRRTQRYLADRGVVSAAVVEHPVLADVRRVKAQSAGTAHTPRATTQRRVLFFTFRGWTTHVVWESVIAEALKLRGAQVEFFVCGGGLPACDNKIPTDVHDEGCGFCSGFAASLLRLWGHRYHTQEGLISRSEVAAALQVTQELSLEECTLLEYEGIPLGKICFLSVARLHRVSRLTSEHAALYRRMLASGIQMVYVGRRLLERVQPDVLVALNGRFFADSIMLHLARQGGIRTVCHERGDQSDAMVFAHDGPVVPYNLDSFWPRFAHESLTSQQEEELERYLEARGAGGGGVKGFWPNPDRDKESVKRRWDITSDRKTAVLFTNVVWDSGVVGQDIAFPDMFDWLRSTVRFFSEVRPDVQLLIRVHPAEVRVRKVEKTVETVAGFVANEYSSLPDNIRVIPADDDSSSYALLEVADLVLVYASSIGLEAATRGSPVVLAAHTNYRNKGFTYDIGSEEQYLSVMKALLDACVAHGNEEEGEHRVALARRFAYLLYFRFMIPLRYVSVTTPGMPRLSFERVDDLLPGECRELDVICDGILSGDDFLRCWM